MRKLPVCVLVLSSISTAAEPPWTTRTAPVTTESGAEAVLERTITRIEAAVPALTPDEKRYVQEEIAFADAMGKKVGIGGSFTSARVTAFHASKPFYESVGHEKIDYLRRSLEVIRKVRTSDERFVV